MVGQLGQISVNIADNLMVGSLGSKALASISLALSIYVVFFISILGVGMAIQPLIAEADGGGDAKKVTSVFKHGLILNLLTALLAIILVENALPLIHLMGQDAAVVLDAIPYLRLNMYSLIPFMLFYAFRSLSEGLGETRPAVMAMLTGNVINIILNYALIYGNWGAPSMGVQGAAVGTFIARVFMLLMIIFILFRWKKTTSLGTLIWSHIRGISWSPYAWVSFKEVLRIGLPTSFQMLFEILAFAGAAILMGVIGAEEQAAHQITINVVSATFMVCMGLATAASIRVGNEMGKGDPQAMKLAGFSNIVQSIMFMSATGVILLALRHWLPTLYIKEESVIEMAAGLFTVAAFFQLSDGVQVVAIGALRGMQDIFYPTVVTFISYLCIGLPFSYFAAFHFDLGYTGIWLGLLIGLTLSAVLNTWRFNRAVNAKIRGA